MGCGRRCEGNAASAREGAGDSRSRVRDAPERCGYRTCRAGREVQSWVCWGQVGGHRRQRCWEKRGWWEVRRDGEDGGGRGSGQ